MRDSVPEFSVPRTNDCSAIDRLIVRHPEARSVITTVSRAYTVHEAVLLISNECISVKIVPIIYASNYICTDLHQITCLCYNLNFELSTSTQPTTIIFRMQTYHIFIAFKWLSCTSYDLYDNSKSQHTLRISFHLWPSTTYFQITRCHFLWITFQFKKSRILCWKY